MNTVNPHRNYFDMKINLPSALACGLLFLQLAGHAAPPPDAYVVVISPATQAQPDWARVAAALKTKHAAEVVVAGVGPECEAALRQRQPRHVCFVARPEEIDAEYVRRIHVVSRRMDDDPFGDFLWGIITGYTAEDALRIAEAREPLVARCGLNTTMVNSMGLDRSLTLSDQHKGQWRTTRAEPVANAVAVAGPALGKGKKAEWSLAFTNGVGTIAKRMETRTVNTNADVLVTNVVVKEWFTVVSNGVAVTQFEKSRDGATRRLQSVVTNGLVVAGTSASGGVATTWYVVMDGGRATLWRNVVTNGLCADTTAASLFGNYYNEQEVDFLVLGGHGSPFNQELPFNSGSLVCSDNRMFVLEPLPFRQWLKAAGAGTPAGDRWFHAPAGMAARRTWVAENPATMLKPSPHPKVVLAPGNCYVGTPERTQDALAVTWLSGGGANQFVGYTIDPQEGAVGWGTLQLWGGGRFNTLSEAFYLSNQRVIHELRGWNPELQALVTATGLTEGERNARLAAAIGKVRKARRKEAAAAFHDLDTAVLYGDPKWEARLGGDAQTVSVDWTAVPEGGWKLTIHAGDDINFGAGWMFLLPQRVVEPKLTVSGGVRGKATDEFVMIHRGQIMETGDTITLTVTPGTGAK